MAQEARGLSPARIHALQSARRLRKEILRPLQPQRKTHALSLSTGNPPSSAVNIINQFFICLGAGL